MAPVLDHQSAKHISSCSRKRIAAVALPKGKLRFRMRAAMAEGHSIDHELAVKAVASSVHDAIATRHGLRGGNTSQVTGDGKVGSEWTLSYEGAPDFSWRVDRSDASGVLWTCTQGPGDSVGTMVEYVFEDMPDGRTRDLAQAWRLAAGAISRVQHAVGRDAVPAQTFRRERQTRACPCGRSR